MEAAGCSESGRHGRGWWAVGLAERVGNGTVWARGKGRGKLAGSRHGGAGDGGGGGGGWAWGEGQGEGEGESVGGMCAESC